MKPQVDQVLGLTAGQIMTEIAPLLPAGYAQSQATLGAVMLSLAAQQSDRAADIRVAENRDMRALFAELAPLVVDANLKAQLEAAAPGEEASLRISALDDSNYALRRLLIALHAHVEELPGDAARKAEARIWGVLRAAAERRQLFLG
jgi:hypothetical protein